MIERTYVISALECIILTFACNYFTCVCACIHRMSSKMWSNNILLINQKNYGFMGSRGGDVGCVCMFDI